jgi:hypothetical protein
LVGVDQFAIGPAMLKMGEHGTEPIPLNRRAVEPDNTCDTTHVFSITTKGDHSLEKSDEFNELPRLAGCPNQVPI